MKVEVSSPTKKFEPITLTITIESKEELLDMYVRTWVNNQKIVDHIKRTYNENHRGHMRDDYIRAVNSISNDGAEVPLLNVLRPLVESL